MENQSQFDNKKISKAANKSKLNAPQAISLLAKQGISVSEEDAVKIVEFVNYLAEITIEQILKSNEPLIEYDPLLTSKNSNQILFKNQ